MMKFERLEIPTFEGAVEGADLEKFHVIALTEGMDLNCAKSPIIASPATMTAHTWLYLN